MSHSNAQELAVQRSFTGLRDWQSQQFDWGSLNISSVSRAELHLLTPMVRLVPLDKPAPGPESIGPSRAVAGFSSAHIWIMSAEELKQATEVQLKGHFDTLGDYRAQTTDPEQLLLAIAPLYLKGLMHIGPELKPQTRDAHMDQNKRRQQEIAGYLQRFTRKAVRRVLNDQPTSARPDQVRTTPVISVNPMVVPGSKVLAARPAAQSTRGIARVIGKDVKRVFTPKPPMSRRVQAAICGMVDLR